MLTKKCVTNRAVELSKCHDPSLVRTLFEDSQDRDVTDLQIHRLTDTQTDRGLTILYSPIF